MNIKKWKEFSDLVDKYNQKTIKELENSFLIAQPFLIKKSQENFWEWQAEKLKLN